MKLEIITPEKKLFVGEVSMVRVPGTLGSFQILKNHAPIVSTLSKGSVIIRKTDNTEIIFEINNGLIECNKNVINILVES
ncbi:MAG: ATP synthase F1 subunit epsilon [Bacteroidales bacterium]|jgi:F-type H+-transporting ATPase subunit epsilon|nr:ATP synthase F1 subunit epsilon [Bacteroidales bacterium]